MKLTPYNCTIRVFDIENGATLEEYILPVNSPDVEHAAASTLANTTSFTAKTDASGRIKQIAFACTNIAQRS